MRQIFIDRVREVLVSKDMPKIEFYLDILANLDQGIPELVGDVCSFCERAIDGNMKSTRYPELSIHLKCALRGVLRPSSSKTEELLSEIKSGIDSLVVLSAAQSQGVVMEEEQKPEEKKPEEIQRFPPGFIPIFRDEKNV